MKPQTLEIDGPTATCGHCRFGAPLKGTFSVEDGLLVWRGDPDVQPGRGPDLAGCCESSPAVEFRRIEVDSVGLDAEDITALRASAEEAVAAQMRAWHEQERGNHDAG